jgi:predicted amidohydrolase YtcJ
MNRTNPSRAARADLVLKNGFIYKMDRDHTLATALVVRGDSIIFVGDDAGALQIASAQSRVIDLQGKLVLPGFFDCHTHAPCGADEIYSVMLNNLGSLDEYRQAIRAFLEAHPDISLLRGVGWHPPFFPPEGPTRQLLDEWAPGIPAVLYAQDYHSAWVNTKALELAGITQATQNPVGGIIQREASGYPSGTLHESAMDLVESIIPPYTVDQLVEGLKYFQQTAHSYGITTIHIPHLELEALYRMVDEETLDLRVVAGLVVQPEDDLTVVEKLVEQRRAVKERMLAKGNAGNPARFEITSAKIFIDGVIESATAYLEQPYAHRPDWRGESLWEVERYKAMCAALDREGFQIHVHAIGDAAVRSALDGLAYARQANRALHGSGRGPRHGITHLQLVNPADLQRFADLEAIAFPQPYWFVVDPFYEQAVAYLGQRRADRQYPMKSFFDKGVLVASASDYPVTIPARPLNAIENGVTRAQLGESEHARVLNPGERVTLPQMLESFTINGARAFGMERMTGSLEVGKLADLIVLDQNIFELPPAQIHTAEVLLTIFNGREVYCSGNTNLDY